MTNPPTRAERQKAELRRDIIDAAFTVFAERGYHVAGIADIAARLGIGHGTVYRYFSNKRDILEHVIGDLVDRTMAALTAENAPEAAETLVEYRHQVGRIADALFDLFHEDPRVPRLLLLQVSGVDQELEQRLLDLLGTAAQIVTGYLHNGLERGFLRADLDAAATAEAVVGLILAGALHTLRAGGPKPSQDAYQHAAIDLMFDGISAER